MSCLADEFLFTPSSKSLAATPSVLRFADQPASDDYNHQNSVRFCFNINQRTFSTESDGSGPRSLDERPPQARSLDPEPDNSGSGQVTPK